MGSTSFDMTGEVGPFDNEFNSLPPIYRADVLRDWIHALEDIHIATVREMSETWNYGYGAYSEWPCNEGDRK
ncbi:hypothetical protein [Maridesulfovibrio ferrireducens]|uniref:hypothetical protein n=1 Tax=Maridesulfovibrio ferrireducens TaxID=246191 RepID=UPI001A306FD6|nr:hypothetical protein [Maridesulfovibrio ferrireducens]MBI9113035.1 hypothetical protein [Maridesulfovibrio ferrireducens]